jgi:hypothetical protein
MSEAAGSDPVPLAAQESREVRADNWLAAIDFVAKLFERAAAESNRQAGERYEAERKQWRERTRREWRELLANGPLISLPLGTLEANVDLLTDDLQDSLDAVSEVRTSLGILQRDLRRLDRHLRRLRWKAEQEERGEGERDA